jgi:hypothetical protein
MRVGKRLPHCSACDVRVHKSGLTQIRLIAIANRGAIIASKMKISSTVRDARVIRGNPWNWKIEKRVSAGFAS